VVAASKQGRWRTDGKFFRSGGERIRLMSVTYGPFPADRSDQAEEDFQRIASAGFNSVRLYDLPGQTLLDAAARHGLKIFAGLDWNYLADFGKRQSLVTGAKIRLARFLASHGTHPALAGVYVGNEIAADLVRWIGPAKVRAILEDIIATGREVAPDVLFAYANYPSTEYLEPANADFTAFNIYLEEEERFRAYLKRLHHVAGDRPLVVSEFGLDSQRNGSAKQAETLRWGCAAARAEEVAGMTIYAWSDLWMSGRHEVLDWDFGLVDREGKPKPALEQWEPALFTDASLRASPSFSVIICTRNGRQRIGTCLAAISRMRGGGFETIVVDDGSDDGTADRVAADFPQVRLLRLEPSGLSAARNAGAAIARHEILAFTDDDCEPDIEWIARLRRAFLDGQFAAAGGPNLPPEATTWREAVVRAAPGAPSHVMLTDEEAEHLPGCNIAVTKAAFDAIGGFDPLFRTAGDDVDFCWRLRDAGFRLGFAPGAFVWHWRRPHIGAFLRQQLGYGRAEKLLLAKHPQRFSDAGGARWEGFVYGGGPVRAVRDSIIYHGTMGTAGYQKIVNRMLPLREIDDRFDSWKSRFALATVNFIQPRLRAWARNRRLLFRLKSPAPPPPEEPSDEFGVQPQPGQDREFFLRFLTGKRWRAAGETEDWDVEKNGTRVLIAKELRADFQPVILFRIWGDAGQLMRYMGVERRKR
jgi:GT2 family glycosyltransferase